jgi:ribonuclease P protein component
VFSRRERLSRADFPLALKTGRRLNSSNFTAVFSEDIRGYAVVVSKKAARLSVTRHRIKRRVLEALRAFPLPRGLIIFPKASAGSVSYKDTKEEIAELLSKINSTKKSSL